MDMDMNIFSSSSFLFLLAAIPLIKLLIIICRWKSSQSAGSRHPPSPPGLPIIGNLHQLGSLLHISLRDLAKKHGPVMMLRLGQVPTLVISSSEMAEQVLKTHDRDCCGRAPSYGSKVMSYNLLDIGFAPCNDYWRELRKLCINQFFTVKKPTPFASTRDSEVHRLLESLSETSPAQVVEIGKKVSSLINNIVCKAVFGKSYEGKQFDHERFELAILEAHELLSCFWMTDIFPKFGWIIDAIKGRNSRLKNWTLEFDSFLTMMINEHLHHAKPEPNTDTDTEDLLDMILKIYKEDQLASFGFSMDHVKALLFDIILGAIKTTSCIIEWAMAELAKNPTAMDKVQSEVRGLVNPKTSFLVQHADIDKLRYLKMVVKECLRLHPPAPLFVPHECIRHCKIGDYDVYPKTMILVNAWAIGRDPMTWERAEEFYPERFEGSNIDFRGRNFELIPFGAGRRICPALEMGTTMVEFVLANMLRGFDWVLPKGMKPEDISMEEETGLTTYKKWPLHLLPIRYGA